MHTLQPMMFIDPPIRTAQTGCAAPPLPDARERCRRKPAWRHGQLFRRVTSALFAALALSGCATLPGSGPDPQAITSNASATLPEGEANVRLSYALVDITPKTTNSLSDQGPGSIARTFGSGGGVPPVRVGAGDNLQVTVFEADQGGLFIPAEAGSRPGNYVTLPEETVDQDGTVTVPYAGKIQAAGQTTAQIQTAIENALKDRAIEPQAVVELVDRQATNASVIGEVNAPNTFSIDASGDRILEMIAKAGGPKHPGYETYVTLQRDGRKGTVFFDTLVNNPSENIYVNPGDTVYVYRQPRTFLAFGASGENNSFEFGAEHLSLAEAVGKAGGTLDNRAEPSHIYVFRLEDRQPLEELGIDLSNFPADQKIIPTIYRADFRQPDAMLVAQHFPMHDKDIVYISNADTVELKKFLSLLDSVTGSYTRTNTAVTDTSW